MPQKPQIWVVKGSNAEKLAAALGAHYDVRALDRNARELTDPANTNSHAPVVVIDDGSAALPPALKANPDGVRVIRLVGTSVLARNASFNHAFLYVPDAAPQQALESAVRAAIENIELAAREKTAREGLATAQRQREQLNQIGVALSSERDISVLLNLILAKAREITGADAGSLYLVEEGSDGKSQLRFKLTQNDSLDFPFKEVTLPLSEDSMAGYTAKP
jgi:hypothetical protein